MRRIPAFPSIPHPCTVFAVLIGMTAVLPLVLSQIGGIPLKSVASPTGIRQSLNDVLSVFVSFYPLGAVLVVMLGVSVAEKSGIVRDFIETSVRIAPPRLLTPLLLLTCMLSHLAADIGYLLILPLAPRLYLGSGRSPLLGLITAYAGVSGCYGASFALTGIDPILAGIAQESIQVADPGLVVSPAVTWLFSCSSSLILTAVLWILVDCYLEPRFTVLKKGGGNGLKSANNLPFTGIRFCWLC